MVALRCIGITAAFSIVLAAADSRIVRTVSVPESKITHKLQPVYPPDALDQHIQGVVKIKILIGTDGHVEQARLVSGHPLLAPAAIQAVKHWVFEPPTSEGQPVRLATQVEIPFRLDGNGNPR
jgi:protein TonB